MSAPVLSFWYDFASTYSYPAALRIEAEAAPRGVSIAWRPFLLGPIFAAQGWSTSPFNLYPAKGRYMWREMERICEAQKLPLAPPDPFPQHSLAAARVATALEGAARAAFTRALYRLEFGLGRNISEQETLEAALSVAGIEAAPALARAQTQDIKDRLRAATEEAIGLGIFGAPSFIAPDGELYWGQDRLEAALDWAAAF